MNAAPHPSPAPAETHRFAARARRRLLPWAAGALLLVPMALTASASPNPDDAQQRRSVSRSSSSKSSAGSQRTARSSRSASRSSASRSQGSKSKPAARSSSSSARSSSSSSARSSSSRRTATRRAVPPSRSEASSNDARRGRDVARTRPDYGRPRADRHDRNRDHHHRHRNDYYGRRHSHTGLSFYLGHYGLFGYPYYYGRYGYGYGYGYGYPHFARYRSSDDMGAVDINVRPKRAEVYVNGQRIGNVGEFDGFPGYLWLEEDIYDIVIYRPGYQTLHQTVEVFPGLVIDIDQDLVPGDAVPPQDIVPPPVRYDGAQGEAYGGPRGSDTATRPGRLYLEIEPEDATVYLDGRFLGSGGEIADVGQGLMLNPGTHQLSVLHPRHGAEEREIEIEPGEEIRLVIEMD